MPQFFVMYFKIFCIFWWLVQVRSIARICSFTNVLSKMIYNDKVDRIPNNRSVIKTKSSTLFVVDIRWSYVRPQVDGWNYLVVKVCSQKMTAFGFWVTRVKMHYHNMTQPKAYKKYIWLTNLDKWVQIDM